MRSISVSSENYKLEDAMRALVNVVVLGQVSQVSKTNGQTYFRVNVADEEGKPFELRSDGYFKVKPYVPCEAEIEIFTYKGSTNLKAVSIIETK